jgi:hypothetical protein
MGKDILLDGLGFRYRVKGKINKMSLDVVLFEA